MKRKIGWQKYEDYLEKQLNSPILNNLMQSIASANVKNIDEEEDEDIDDEEDYEDEDEDGLNKKPIMLTPFIPITNKLIDDISMLANFECWMGHTNFDITPNIKNILNDIPGVELLKICSRYRFFIGIGQMFDFKNVRQHIEDSLIEGE